MAGCGSGAWSTAAGVRCGYSAAPAPGSAQRPLWKRPEAHRKAWTKLWISLSNSGSCLRMSSILRTEWITVEWCLPPNSLPISGSEAPVRLLVQVHRDLARQGDRLGVVLGLELGDLEVVVVGHVLLDRLDR